MLCSHQFNDIGTSVNISKVLDSDKRVETYGISILLNERRRWTSYLIGRKELVGDPMQNTMIAIDKRHNKIAKILTCKSMPISTVSRSLTNLSVNQ